MHLDLCQTVGQGLRLGLEGLDCILDVFCRINSLARRAHATFVNLHRFPAFGHNHLATLWRGWTMDHSRQHECCATMFVALLIHGTNLG